MPASHFILLPLFPAYATAFLVRLARFETRRRLASLVRSFASCTLHPQRARTERQEETGVRATNSGTHHGHAGAKGIDHGESRRAAGSCTQAACGATAHTMLAPLANSLLTTPIVLSFRVSLFDVPVVQSRLPPDVSRILYVKSLPFKMSEEELYDLFGRYGAIRQIRLGSTPETRGRAYVVYEDIFDAKSALEKLTGFNVMGRYIVVLYHSATGTGAGDKNRKAGGGGSGTMAGAISAQQTRLDMAKKREELEKVKAKFGVKGVDE